MRNPLLNPPNAPLIMVVSSPHIPQESRHSALCDAASAGAQFIQLRDKSASALELFREASLLSQRLPEGALLLINDRVDVALAVNAAGVHLPERGLSISVSRRLLGPDKLIGRSVHSVASAIEAAEAGADYLLVGTMFETSSKPGKVPEGPGLLAKIESRVDCPLLGIGGVTPGRAGELMSAGASGCAVISYILRHDDPGKGVGELRSSMRQDV